MSFIIRPITQDRHTFAFPAGQEGAPITLICRRPTATELGAFLRDRFRAERHKVENRTYEARAQFARSILVDAEGLEYEDASGTVRALDRQTDLGEEDRAAYRTALGTDVDAWVDLVPAQLLYALASRYEAEPEAVDGDHSRP